MTPKVLLSFDVEEFDMPLEYNFNIAIETQMEIGKKGLDNLMPILNDQNYTTTLFTTANFANKYSDSIKALSEKHEIASHTFYHSKFSTVDLLASRIRLEEIIQKPVKGLRMPRMRQVRVGDINEAGYSYDASIHPTWLPGRYNNFHLPRTKYSEQGLIRVPASVSPNFRIPLFWLSFKNFPYAIYLNLALQTLNKDGYLSLYFHPWEFTNITAFGLPKYTTKGSDNELLDKLYRLMNDLNKLAEFVTMGDFIQNGCME
ncbi:MAG TPA: polysaccharide deacetylase [Chitinophagaceae bacterium]|nr:polysaccharide deacetylase [Chitinophagaceae bacterium]